MYRYISILLSLTVLSTICLMSFADSEDMNGDEAIYEAVQVTVPPKIDGVLDDVIWKVAPSVTLGLLDTGEVVDEEYFSTAWAVYDSEKIYVAFKNFDPDPGQITVQHKGRDTDTWQDDENELFIEPANAGTEPYFQFCINAESEIFDQIRGGAGTAWNAESLECATKIYDDHWVLELSVLFDDLKDLDVKAAPVGETWGWNFTRHVVSGVDLWTTWSDTGVSFHTPSRFGDIVFTEEEMDVNSAGKISITWGKIKSSLEDSR